MFAGKQRRVHLGHPYNPVCGDKRPRTVLAHEALQAVAAAEVEAAGS